MNAETSEPADFNLNPSADRHDGTPSGVILERFKRMRHLPPHMLDLQDEFFVQSFLRRKRSDI